MSVAQSRLTLCDPLNGGPPGSSVHGISQTRILEWVAISSSRGSSQPRDRSWASHTAGRLFTVWAPGKANIVKRWLRSRPFNTSLSLSLLLPWGCVGSLLEYSLSLPRSDLVVTHGLWDLSSPTRDRTCNVCTGRRIRKRWTTREVPIHF